MKVTLESTSRIVEINGVKVRVWEGHTENGVACHALIATVACHKDADASEFQKSLLEMKAPSAEGIKCFPLRMFID